MSRHSCSSACWSSAAQRTAACRVRLDTRPGRALCLPNASRRYKAGWLKPSMSAHSLYNVQPHGVRLRMSLPAELAAPIASAATEGKT